MCKTDSAIGLNAQKGVGCGCHVKHGGLLVRELKEAIKFLNLNSMSFFPRTNVSGFQSRSK
jgi:hypothetical protein